jgi:hypothetical protein
MNHRLSIFIATKSDNSLHIHVLHAHLTILEGDWTVLGLVRSSLAMYDASHIGTFGISPIVAIIGVGGISGHQKGPFT